MSKPRKPKAANKPCSGARCAANKSPQNDSCQKSAAANTNTTATQGATANHSAAKTQSAAKKTINNAATTLGPVEEPAGGCGVCNSAGVTGTAVHGLVQHNSFPASINAEVTLGSPIWNPQDEENGRLDLARMVFGTYPRVTIQIGEIKPNNRKGVRDGARDLEFYRQRVIELVRKNKPDFDVAVEYLDTRPNPALLQFQERESCPPQAVTVSGTRGLYLYSCSPPRSQMSQECCNPKDENEDAIKDSQIAQLGLKLGEEVAKRVEKKTAEVAVEDAAVAWGARFAGGLARVAMKASLLLTGLDITLSAYSALANYAYGSMYKGTRGYLLMVALQYIGTQSEKLANAGGYALYLGGTLSMSDSEGECGEIETYDLRNELFDALYKFRVALYNAVGTVDGYGKEYSALAKRVDWGDQTELQLALQVVDGLIASGDRSPLGLMLLADELTPVAEKYADVVERIYNEREGIVHDDIRNWLALRK